MNVRHLVIPTLLALTMSLPSSRLRAQTRIGIYDSRAVAIAFANSPAGQKAMQELLPAGDLEAAKTDKTLKEALEKKARAHQTLNHLRAFSTVSVAPILERYGKELSAVATAADVACIVSKYELSFSGEGVELVDLTKQIVGLFQTSAQGLKWVGECEKQAPLPILDVLMLPAEE